MASLIGKVALNPLFTAPLLLLLTRAPDEIREPVLQHLRQYVSEKTIAKAVTTLTWLTALGLASWANEYLSELAQNNFRLRSEKDRYDWPKEIAFITGAAGGFGSRMSKDLAAKGVTIIAVDIVESPPADMKSNPKIHYYQCDITNKEAVDALADKVRQTHGDPSILINNAGIAIEHSIVKSTAQEVQKIFAVNVMAHYYTCAAFLPAMYAAKKGHVVTIASMASFASPPGMVSYSNTKVAALSFHEGLQAEARTFHNAPEVKFTCVHPTFAATNMVAEHLDQLQKARMLVLDPQVVADAVVKQILSCRGRQILIAGNVGGFITQLRSFPHWLSTLLFMLGERARTNPGQHAKSG